MNSRNLFSVLSMCLVDIISHALSRPNETNITYEIKFHLINTPYKYYRLALELSLGIIYSITHNWASSSVIPSPNLQIKIHMGLMQWNKMKRRVFPPLLMGLTFSLDLDVPEAGMERSIGEQQCLIRNSGDNENNENIRHYHGHDQIYTSALIIDTVNLRFGICLISK